MNKKFIKIIISLLLIMTIGTTSFALDENILINDETFSFINKDEKILSYFDNNYNIISENDDKNYETKNEIKELTKKTTYLLLGEPNNKDESSENYFKRHRDYLKLRYNPEIPKDENTSTGFDESSQEYEDDILSGLSVPSMFLMLSELDVKYNSYGDIRVSVVSDEAVVSTIKLSNVIMKQQNATDKTKYDYIQTDLTMYYYFKRLNDEYKLLYLYGETNNDIEEYISKSEEKSGELTKDPDYNSQLSNVYDFSKANMISDSTLSQIYNENKDKIVFLNSVYNLGTVTSANGFFITDNLIVTTSNYIEKSLIKAQDIIISDSSGEVYELDGIVTMNLENDIAILKVKNEKSKAIKLEEIDQIGKEDAVITLNSKIGVGLTTSKGIIISLDNDIQTSLPMTEEIQGSPIFNSEGKLMGMMNSKTLNTSISYVTSNNVLKKYYDKLSNIDYNEIRAIPFEEIKENYYIKYNDENVVNSVSEDKLKEYPELANIDQLTGLKLVKSSYEDGIISLRYKNDIVDYVDTMQMASEYKESLKSKGYKENNISDYKVIYKNSKYQIIIMTEFDYLIIVMVKL